MQFGAQLPAFAYTHLTAAATTTIKTGAGYLHTISLNTPGVGAGTIQVFDNTAGSGTLIASITTGSLGTLVLDVAFTIGLTIVIAAYVTSQPDITVSWN